MFFLLKVLGFHCSYLSVYINLKLRANPPSEASVNESCHSLPQRLVAEHLLLVDNAFVVMLACLAAVPAFDDGLHGRRAALLFVASPGTMSCSPLLTVALYSPFWLCSQPGLHTTILFSFEIWRITVILLAGKLMS